MGISADAVSSGAALSPMSTWGRCPRWQSGCPVPLKQGEFGIRVADAAECWYFCARTSTAPTRCAPPCFAGHGPRRGRGGIADQVLF